MRVERALADPTVDATFPEAVRAPTESSDAGSAANRFAQYAVTATQTKASATQASKRGTLFAPKVRFPESRVSHAVGVASKNELEWIEREHCRPRGRRVDFSTK